MSSWQKRCVSELSHGCPTSTSISTCLSKKQRKDKKTLKLHFVIQITASLYTSELCDIPIHRCREAMEKYKSRERTKSIFKKKATTGPLKSRFRQAVSANQEQLTRKGLLDMMKVADPSSNYNMARDNTD